MTIALTVALSLVSTSAMAFNVDANTMTPTITFPEPVSEPVTRDAGGKTVN